MLLATGLLVCISYGYSLGSGFAPYDDPVLIVGNPSAHSIGASLGYFKHSVSFTSDLRSSGESFYRPLFWLSLGADASLWGLHAAGFHATSLLLHWLNGVLLYYLLLRLGLERTLTRCTVLVWLVLPINSEAVVWIAARSYLLVTFFLLAGLLCGERYLAKRSRVFLAGYVLAGACAMLAHEQGILLLPLVVLIAAVLKQVRSRQALILYSAAAVLDVLDLLLVHAVGVKSAAQIGVASTAGLIMARYLGWLILPVRMSVERSTDTPTAGWSALSVATLISATVLICLVSLVRQVPQYVRTGLMWMVICLLPFLGLVVIYQGMAERYLYIASIGLALTVCALCAATPVRTRPWIAGVVVLWICWGFGRLEWRLADWRDPVRLYRSSLAATPRSFKLGYNLGAVYEEEGRYGEALVAYRESLRSNIAYEPSIAGMGNAYLLMNDPDMARKFYEQALLRDNNDVKTINNYGTSLDKLGRLNDAKRQYMRAIALAPTNDTAYCDLATLFYDAGDADVAEALFKKAIGVNQHDPLPYSNLAAIYTQQFRKGRTDRKEPALAMYQKVLELDPGDSSAIEGVRSLQH
jgi:Tfp pilus assembly protein PilF